MSALSVEEGADIHDEPVLSGCGYLTGKKHLKVNEFHSFSTKTPLGHPLGQLYTWLHTEGAVSSDFSSSMVIVLRKRKVPKSSSGPAESEMTAFLIKFLVDPDTFFFNCC